MKPGQIAADLLSLRTCELDRDEIEQHGFILGSEHYQNDDRYIPDPDGYGTWVVVDHPDAPYRDVVTFLDKPELASDSSTEAQRLLQCATGADLPTTPEEWEELLQRHAQQEVASSVEPEEPQTALIAPSHHYNARLSRRTKRLVEQARKFRENRERRKRTREMRPTAAEVATPPPRTVGPRKVALAGPWAYDYPDEACYYLMITDEQDEQRRASAIAALRAWIRHDPHHHFPPVPGLPEAKELLREAYEAEGWAIETLPHGRFRAVPPADCPPKDATRMVTAFLNSLRLPEPQRSFVVTLLTADENVALQQCDQARVRKWLRDIRFKKAYNKAKRMRQEHRDTLDRLYGSRHPQCLPHGAGARAAPTCEIIPGSTA